MCCRRLNRRGYFALLITFCILTVPRFQGIGIGKLRGAPFLIFCEMTSASQLVMQK